MQKQVTEVNQQLFTQGASLRTREMTKSMSFAPQQVGNVTVERAGYSSAKVAMNMQKNGNFSSKMVPKSIP